MKLSWSNESMLRLAEIEQFIAINSPKKAIEFVDYLISQVESITSTPYIGRIVKEISDPSIRELVIKNYRIVYKFRDNEFTVLTVFEGHRLFRIDEIK